MFWEARRADRRGFILPVVILVLLGGTLMAASLLVAARSAVALAEGDRLLARRLAGRGAFAGAVSVEAVPASAPERALEGGFVLLADTAGEGGLPAGTWRSWAIGWRPTPGVIASLVNATAETGGGITGGGIVRAAAPEEGCGDPEPLPPHHVVDAVREPQPDPPLQPSPRLGPVAATALASRAEVALEGIGELPARAEPILYRASAGGVVSGGPAAGILVATGSLVLAGPLEFNGLLLATGDLHMTEGARVAGAALVGGELLVEEGSLLLGCRESLAEVLGHVAPLGHAFRIPGGDFLGRY